MVEFENPYICFNCTKVGKCPKAIVYTHNTDDCKNFELYKEEKTTQIFTQQLAEILGMSLTMFYENIRVCGWKHVAEKLREKGVNVYREKSGNLDKRFKSNRYVYYIKE